MRKGDKHIMVHANSELFEPTLEGEGGCWLPK
jgi:hypothetical protein